MNLLNPKQKKAADRVDESIVQYNRACRYGSGIEIQSAEMEMARAEAAAEDIGIHFHSGTNQWWPISICGSYSAYLGMMYA